VIDLLLPGRPAAFSLLLGGGSPTGAQVHGLDMRCELQIRGRITPALLQIAVGGMIASGDSPSRRPRSTRPLLLELRPAPPQVTHADRRRRATVRPPVRSLAAAPLGELISERQLLMMRLGKGQPDPPQHPPLSDHSTGAFAVVIAGASCSEGCRSQLHQRDHPSADRLARQGDRVHCARRRLGTHINRRPHEVGQ
jgi:hypothetical protein